MITSVTEDRLLVISDVHLGNRLFPTRKWFIQFLHFAHANSCSVCINGDGIDIVQSSLQRITGDVAACSSCLRQLARKGLRVYYVVGNHDVILENFLADWGVVQVVPFLNVNSGGKRIHIEHGHLFDEGFVHFPRCYMLSTLIGGWCLKVHPALYRFYEKLKPAAEKLCRLIKSPPYEPRMGKDCPGIPNEPRNFLEGAAEVATHGFDYVILGHTHCCGEVPIGEATYLNTGCWLSQPQYIDIDRGQVAMKPVPSSRELEEGRKTAMNQRPLSNQFAPHIAPQERQLSSTGSGRSPSE